jgi:HK97 family phage major capsid protein
VFSAAATLVAEQGAYTTSEPTLTNVVFVPYKYTKLARISEELASDSRVDVWREVLSPDFEQAFTSAENTALTTGTGTGQPQGVVPTIAIGHTLPTGQTTSFTNFDGILELIHSVPVQYWAGARFMMHPSTWRALRIVKEAPTGNNQYVLEEPTSATPAMLFGYPVVFNPAMAVPAANARTVVFGNFSIGYRIADWPGLGLQRLDELYAANGLIGFRAFRRLDGRVVLADALRALAMSAT